MALIFSWRSQDVRTENIFEEKVREIKGLLFFRRENVNRVLRSEYLHDIVASSLRIFAVNGL